MGPYLLHAAGAWSLASLCLLANFPTVDISELYRKGLPLILQGEWEQTVLKSYTKIDCSLDEAKHTFIRVMSNLLMHRENVSLIFN
jgi:hypothetical protein